MQDAELIERLLYLERRLKTVRETLEAEILELKTDMRVLQTRFDAHKVSCRNGDV